jgi:hypothetical protein
VSMPYTPKDAGKSVFLPVRHPSCGPDAGALVRVPSATQAPVVNITRDPLGMTPA